MDQLFEFPKLTHDEQEAVLNGPAFSPPKGVIPDFNKPGNRNGAALAFSVVCLFLVVTLSLVRAYARIFVLKRVALEDYVGLCAILAFAGLAAAFYMQLHYGGFFVHQWNVRLGDLQKVLLANAMLTLAYPLTMLFAKTAILLEWTKLFFPAGVKRDAFYWTFRFITGLNIVLYTGGFIAECFACVPLSRSWNLWEDGYCIDTKALDVSTAYFNLAVDFLILLLPQRVIWRLKLTRSKRLGVSIIFSFGLLTSVCALGRLIANQTLPYERDTDQVYAIAPIYLWIFAETTCLLIVFAVPGVPAAFSNHDIGGPIRSVVRRWKRPISVPIGPDDGNGGRSHVQDCVLDSPIRVKDKAPAIELKPRPLLAMPTLFRHSLFLEGDRVTQITQRCHDEESMNLTAKKAVASQRALWL